MRLLILSVCAGVTLSAQAVVPPSVLDEPMRGAVRVIDPSRSPPCELWTSLEQLARHAQVRIGFEQTPDCRPAGWMRLPYDRPAVSLDGLSPRDAFDRLLSHRSDYRWAVIDGVAVFRPEAAWAGVTVLNAPASPFAVAEDHPHHALHTLFQATQPSLFQEHTDLKLSSNGRRLEDPHSTTRIDAPVSVRFAGGNVIQALNAISRGFGGVWQAAYTPRGDHRRSLWVALYTLDDDWGVTNLSSAAFTIPPDTPR